MYSWITAPVPSWVFRAAISAISILLKSIGLEIAPIICEKDDPLYEELKDERELKVTFG